ncbi:MAG: RNA polymerase sigma factor [bacterium]|nr:RNA polymerase sigma factor [bacterium]
MNKNDEELIKAYLGGEEAALRELIARYLRIIYNFSYKYVRSKTDAEDVTQEVFIKIWKNLKRYKPETSFRTWLFSIAKNTAIDRVRKKQSLVFSDFENEEGANPLLESLTDSVPLPDELSIQSGDRAFLENTINQLPPAYRKVLRLHYNSHFTFDEIGKTLGKPLNTVKSHHRRALIALKKLLNAPKDKRAP